MIYLLATLGLALLALVFIGQRAATNAYRLLDVVARRVGAESAAERLRPTRGWVFVVASPVIGALLLVNASRGAGCVRGFVASIALGAARSTWGGGELRGIEAALTSWVRG